MNRRLTGRNPLLYSAEKSGQEVKDTDFGALLESGVFCIPFHVIISRLPPHVKDCGLYGNAHLYISEEGITMYSYSCRGYIRKTAINFRGRQLPRRSEPAFFFCQWSHLREPLARERRVIFYTRSYVSSFPKSLRLFENDMIRAKAVYDSSAYPPLSIEEEHRKVKCQNGLYADPSGYVFIVKHDHHNRYFFEKWLELKTFNLLLQFLKKINNKAKT